MDIIKWCKLLLLMSKCVAVTTVRSTNGHPNGLLQVELTYEVMTQYLLDLILGILSSITESILKSI